MKWYFSPKEVGVPDMTSWGQVEAMQDLIIHVLNPLREAYGKPIKINSGYRTPEHNKAIGGAANSQHLCLDVAACDIDAGSVSENKKLFELLKVKFQFDQLIYENGGQWLHVSFTTSRPNRKQALELSK